MINLKNKREFIYRKKQGEIHKDNYFNKIRTFINEDVDINRFLNLEETDLLISKMYYKNLNLLWSKKKYDCSYKEVVDFIRSKIKKQLFYLLIDKEGKYCEAYKVINDISEEYDFEKLVSNEIQIISYDLSFQIRIDYDSNEIGCEYITYK